MKALDKINIFDVCDGKISDLDLNLTTGFEVTGIDFMARDNDGKEKHINNIVTLLNGLPEKTRFQFVYEKRTNDESLLDRHERKYKDADPDSKFIITDQINHLKKGKLNSSKTYLFVTFQNKIRFSLEKGVLLR